MSSLSLRAPQDPRAPTVSHDLGARGTAFCPSFPLPVHASCDCGMEGALRPPCGLVVSCYSLVVRCYRGQTLQLRRSPMVRFTKVSSNVREPLLPARCPDDQKARELCHQIGHPLVAEPTRWGGHCQSSPVRRMSKGIFPLARTGGRVVLRRPSPSVSSAFAENRPGTKARSSLSPARSCGARDMEGAVAVGGVRMGCVAPASGVVVRSAHGGLLREGDERLVPGTGRTS